MPKSCSGSDKAFIACIAADKVKYVDEWEMPEARMNMALSVEIDDQGTAARVWITARENRDMAPSRAEAARRAARIQRVQQIRDAL